MTDFERDFAAAQRMLRLNDTEGLAALAGRSASKRAVEAAARARGSALTAKQADQPCMLHKIHTPSNLTTEYHHTVPVAWQLFIPAPANPPAPGPDTSGRGPLWDTRGIWICPTGHRNVHFWIERLMHFAKSLSTEDPVQCFQMLTARQGRLLEAQQALLGLQRFVPFGSLLALTAAGEWGQV